MNKLFVDWEIYGCGTSSSCGWWAKKSSNARAKHKTNKNQNETMMCLNFVWAYILRHQFDFLFRHFSRKKNNNNQQSMKNQDEQEVTYLAHVFTANEHIHARCKQQQLNIT